MPRTELPSKQTDGSPNWVEWNGNWMSGVRFHVKAAVEYETGAVPGASEVVQVCDGANDDRQRLALWAQQITAWSWSDQGIPVPSQNAGGPGDRLDGPGRARLHPARRRDSGTARRSDRFPYASREEREGTLNDLISYFHKSGKGVALPEGITDRDIWEDYFAEAFGWPPQVVAELPPRFLDVNPLIREARMRAAKLRGK